MDNNAQTWQAEKETLIFQKNRSREQFSCVLDWLSLLEEGTNLLPYFRDHRCVRIAVYGAAQIGEMLLKEIGGYDRQMRVLYFLDRNAERQREKCGLPVYLPEEFPGLPRVDMTVVTAISYFDQVRDLLFWLRPDVPTVSLRTIIDVRKDEVWHEKR